MKSVSNKIFLGCDWGSTHLRLYLVDADTKTMIDSISTGQGIISTFDYWKLSNPSENDRLSFYQRIIEDNIRTLETSSGISLKDTPLIISGMASSNMGMMELPYAKLPFHTDGSDLNIGKFELKNVTGRQLLLVSGVCSDNDVMRGEELQLIGSCKLTSSTNHLSIFPGTHSKHIMVSKGMIADFKTYITGELFQLLVSKSSLSAFLEKAGLEETGNIASFEQGIIESQQVNVLNSLFHVRSSYLLNQMDGERAYNYLSGLLIGTCLEDLSNYKEADIVLVADELQKNYYRKALDVLNFGNVQHIDSIAATINGYISVFTNEFRQ